MTLQELQTKANGKLTSLWDNHILPKQESYFLKHKTFFGFNWTPALSVVDGADTDFGDIQRPSRKHFAADVSFPTNEQVPLQIQIMRHHGEDHAFTAMVRVELLDGTRYLRTRKATPLVQDTPLAITDWTIETSPWEEIIDPII